MQQKIQIIDCFFVDETEGRIYRNRKGARKGARKAARKAVKKGHSVRAIVTTKEGEKRLGTSFIVSIKKKYIETNNSLYVFV